MDYNNLRVTAVVVTHNRCQLLSQCLAALQEQSRPCDQVVIVDNASTDGTAEMLAQVARQAKIPLHLVHSEQNLGGAGGFALGMDTAFQFAPDCLWLMDDDTLPESKALACLLERVAEIKKAHSKERLGFLASKVLWTDGHLHRMNQPGYLSQARSLPDEPIDYASFVSLLVNAEAVRACGLPIAEFFIGSDDVEYTWRLTRAGYLGYYAPDSSVQHQTASNLGCTLWTIDCQPEEVERWAYKIRNLVAVNRRRSWGWVRELSRILLLTLVWRWHGMNAAQRRRLLRAAWNGLTWHYEKHIRYPS